MSRTRGLASYEPSSFNSHDAGGEIEVELLLSLTRWVREKKPWDFLVRHFLNKRPIPGMPEMQKLSGFNSYA